MQLPLRQNDIQSSISKIGYDRTPLLEYVSGIVINKIAGMRFILALSIFLAINFGSSVSDSSVVTKKLLAGYMLYSLLLCLLTLHQNRLSRWIQHWSPWADICWYTLLFVFGIETSGIFYFGFFFAILAASFSQGFASGLLLTFSSSILISVIGYLALPTGQEFEWGHFLLQPLFLLVMGPMIAYWGGTELKLKRQLLLLKEINRLSNPRFGVDRTLGYVMEQLRTFFSADSCVMVTSDNTSSSYILRRTCNNHPEKAANPELISAELADQLLSLPPKSAIIYRSAWPILSWPGRAKCYEYDIMTGKRHALTCEKVSTVPAYLDATSFISVPIRQNYQFVGRIYLTSARKWFVFANFDVEFLHQVVEHVMPILENIRLVDRLASDAAERERQRIARDIHDTVVQPYIGLQMGLTAVRKKIQVGGANVEGDIDRLFELTGHGISDLRSYIYGLKTNGKRATSLEPAVRRFAEKFSEATGILVQVEFDDKNQFHVNDRLTAEIFQMVAEGLSNIRRHTQSARALVAIACHSGLLRLHIENDIKSELPVSFAPRSLSERAAALGGRIRVNQSPSGSTVVGIEIPL